MGKLLPKIRNWLEKLDRKVLFWILMVVGIIIFISAVFKISISDIGKAILVFQVVTLVTITWIFATGMILKALFALSAELSLVIFIAQAYCGTPPHMHTANGDLSILIYTGFFYIAAVFVHTIYQELKKLKKEYEKISKDLSFWLITVVFLFFLCIFVWQIVQVLSPIVLSLCIYQS